jgi:serine/threonine protein kinase
VRDVRFPPGTRLGPYEIRTPRDLPALGEVFDARDHGQQRDVTLRILRIDFGASPERLRRFEQDTLAAAALVHPNLLTVHNIGTDAQAAYIVSEPLEGATLGESLNRGVLPVSTVIQYALQIAHGLAAAHQKGVVHGDLRPDNILIAPDDRVKILGVGLAAATQNESALPALRGLSGASAMSTLSYMSPEQVRGMPAPDHRSDIFTLGAILYEMLSGARAFSGVTSLDTMRAILQREPPALAAGHDIPPAIFRVVNACLVKDPAARVATAAEIASVLHTLGSQRAPAAPLAAAAGARPPKRRFRVWSWIAVVVGVAALAAVVAPEAMGTSSGLVASNLDGNHGGHPDDDHQEQPRGSSRTSRSPRISSFPPVSPGSLPR